MHNEMVYKYWRWLAWNASRQGRLMAWDFYIDWAEQERVKQ